MFTVLLIGAGTLVLWLSSSLFLEERTLKGLKKALLATVVMGGIAYGLLSLLALGIEHVASPEETRIVNIYSMGDGLGSEGHFFGGFGSIDSETVFMYYTKDEDGYFKLRHVDADQVRIVEEDSAYPHYEKQCGNSANLAGWLRMPGWKYDSIICDPYGDRTFFVPSGSVKQQFNLDAS